MLHHWNKMGFWSHHAVAFCLAAAWIVAVKSFSVARFGADLLQTFFNTTFVLAITWILITAVFELISATNRDQMKFDVRIIVAVVIGAIIASLVAPVFNWVLGATPPGLDLGTDRNDILAFLTEKIPKRITGFLLSIAPFWFVTNWGWYAHRESAGVYSTLGQPRRVATPVSGDNAHAGRQKTVTSMPPAFLRKLPPEKRGALWAITAEQHYLRIYTSAGDDLVLMRFSDALNDLKGVNGQQIHRSHWVSVDGFKGFSEEDKRLFVILKNDVALPVSRPNYTAAKAAFPEAEQEDAGENAALEKAIDAAQQSAT